MPIDDDSEIGAPSTLDGRNDGKLGAAHVFLQLNQRLMSAIDERVGIVFEFLSKKTLIISISYRDALMMGCAWSTAVHLRTNTF